MAETLYETTAEIEYFGGERHFLERIVSRYPSAQGKPNALFLAEARLRIQQDLLTLRAIDYVETPATFDDHITKYLPSYKHLLSRRQLCEVYTDAGGGEGSMNDSLLGKYEREYRDALNRFLSMLPEGTVGRSVDSSSFSYYL